MSKLYDIVQGFAHRNESFTLQELKDFLAQQERHPSDRRLAGILGSMMGRDIKRLAHHLYGRIARL